MQFNHVNNRRTMFQKQLESIAAFLCACFMVFPPVVSYPFLIYLLYIGSYPRYFAVVYLIHLYFDWDSKSCDKHHYDWFVTSKFFKLVMNYYSVSMDAEVEIPQNKNYIIGLHPHGVLCFGTFIHFNREDKNYKKVFGNGKVANFSAHYSLEIPFLREYFFLLKCMDASADTILNWLSVKGVSRFAGLYVGGSEEALISTSKTHKVILKKRKGFIRLAILSGSDIIPSYTFGETEVWDTVQVDEKSIIAKIQRFAHKHFNIGLPIVKGQWRYMYMFAMPKRIRLMRVFGRPLQVQQNDNPSREEVAELHEEYCKALKKLFDDNKAKYLEDKNAELIIQ